MLCAPCCLSSSTRACASDGLVRSLVSSEIGTPSTPPSAFTRSRAICTPAYSCFASGACGPVRGNTAPTLTVLAAAGPVGAVAQAVNTMTIPTAADSRNRTAKNSRRLRLFDALHQDGHERAERGDAHDGVEERCDRAERHPECRRGRRGEHRERDPGRRHPAPGGVPDLQSAAPDQQEGDAADDRERVAEGD